MDKQELRRKIAEASGWREFEWLGPRKDYLWALAPPGHLWSTAEKPAKMQVPDGPNDDGAALALCSEIVPDAWVAVRKWDGDKYLATALETSGGFYERIQGTEMGATPAEALARLAYAALQAQAVRDE